MFTIKKATTNDIQLINEMAQIVFPATYREILSKEQLDYMMDWMYSPKNLRKQMEEEGHIYYIAYKDGEAAGYVSIQPEGEHLFHLQKIYVLPRFQGCRLGKALFEQAVKAIKEIHPGPCEMHLNVNRNNKALQFYQHLGMEKVAEGDFHIGYGYYYERLYHGTENLTLSYKNKMDEYRINGLTIKENLLQLAENGNKKFTESLHPGIENVLGIRIPALRRLGTQIAKDDWESYLQTADTYYMEERMLQGMVISNLKMKDTEAYLSLVARFIAIINSWSVCDTFDFYGKQRFVDKNKKRVWLFLEDRMKSDKEYEIRFGVVMAMAHYIDEEYIDNVLQWMDRISHEGYYVKMAVAWALSVCYVKFPQKTMNYLKENHLDDFTYNKALQKIIESYRVSTEDKEIIRSMKRKNK